MKKSILVMTLLTLLCGCKMGGIRGSGTRKTEKKELPAFKAIETGGAFDVETKAVEITNSGAGLIDTHELRSSKADVNLSGAGQAEVYASEQLDVAISGVGRVTYSGQPKVINKNISGIGSVSARD